MNAETPPGAIVMSSPLPPRPTAAFANRANRYARRLTRKIALVAVLLAALMWLFIGELIWSEREAALSHGDISGRNLAAAFAMELNRTVERIDGAMDAIIRRMPIDHEGRPRIPDLEQWSKDFTLLAHPARYLGIIAANGRLIYSNNPFQTGVNGSSDVDLTDRDHFRIHRDRPDHGLYISIPLRGRVAEGYLLYFTKRLETSDGKFAGVLAFLVPPIELTRMREHVNLGVRGTLSVIGTDDIIRVRVSAEQPNGELGLGVSIRGDPWPNTLAPGAYGSFIRPGQITPVDRQFNYRRLDRYPLIVSVGLDLDDLLREARPHAWLLCGIGVGVTVLVFALAFLLIREIGRRIHRDVALADERLRLEAARTVIQEEQAKLSHAQSELLTAVERAEAANHAKSRFLAHMSHELRTPLHAIIGFSEIIQDQAPRHPSSAVFGDYAGDILASGRHLLSLINAILDISKVESGTERLLESRVNVADEIHASLTTVATRARERGVALDVALADNLPPLRADATKLRQIVINLLSNAVKFTEPGGHVGISTGIAEDGALRVTVRDTGIGMTKAEVEIALQPFGQVDSSLSRHHEGTGLGLPLAQRLVELHGGTLRIDSVKGQGTVIEIRFPADRVG